MAFFNVIADCGKFATKAIIVNNDGSVRQSKNGTDIRYYCETKTKLSNVDLPDSPNGNIHSVTYKGKRYLVGQGSNEAGSDKGTEGHKICLFTAIALLVDNKAEVTLVIGCPMNVYINADQKKSLIERLIPRNERHVEITVDGREHNLKIASIMPLPESYGPLQLDPDYLNGTTGIIDIGGWNTNASFFNDGILDTDKSFTLDHGGHLFVKRLQQELSRGTGKNNIDERLILKAVEAGQLPVPEDDARAGIIQTINAAIPVKKQEFLAKIKADTVTYGWDDFPDHLIFSGGTSKYFAADIKEVFPGSVLVSDCQWANVYGFAKKFAKLCRRDK